MAEDTFSGALSGLSQSEQEHKHALDYLTASLANRNGNTLQQQLLAISQGMLAPSKTGSFGEGLGQAAGNVLALQKEQEAANIENAKMRMQIAQAQRQAAQEKATSEGLANLYKTTDAGLEFQPEMAMKLAQITKDPKFVQMAYEQDKLKRTQAAGRTVFTPTTTTDEKGRQKTSYQFNPDSVFALAQASDNPMETISKYADMVPKLRKAGMLKDLQGDITTPFDAIALMSTDPAIKLQAQNLAKQYQKGLIDDDKANTLSQQMLSMMTSHMDRQQQMQFNQVMQGMMAGLRQEGMNIQREKWQEKKDEKTQAQNSIINAADDMLEQVDKIDKHPGRYSGLGSLDPRRKIPGTNEFDFDQQMETLRSRSFLSSIQQMRGMGALSDAEGKKIQSALAALNPGMSKAEFESSLNMIRRTMDRAKDNAIRLMRGEKPRYLDEKGKEYEGNVPRSWEGWGIKEK